MVSGTASPTVHAVTVTGLSSLLASVGKFYTVAAFPHFPDVQIEEVVFSFLTSSQLSYVDPLLGPSTATGTDGVLSVAFTDGDTVRRVTITDTAIVSTSKIIVSIQRPNLATDADDGGYLYVANVVNVGTGTADVVVACCDRGFGDTTEQPPNETISLVYRVLA